MPVSEDINESIVCSQCHGFRIWIHIKRTSVEGEPISYCKCENMSNLHNTVYKNFNNKVNDNIALAPTALINNQNGKYAKRYLKNKQLIVILLPCFLFALYYYFK